MLYTKTSEINFSQVRSMLLEFSILLVIAFALMVGTGTYIFYELVQYSNEKPPGTQTLLDRIYVQHFQASVIRNIMLTIAFSTLALGVQLPWYLSLPLGWGFHFSKCLVGIQLFVCLIIKVFLIYKPEVFEQMSDDTLCYWIW